MTIRTTPGTGAQLVRRPRMQITFTCGDDYLSKDAGKP
jgi:hypothetical protein